MVPIEDWPEDRRHRFPAVMLGILAVNIAVFIYQVTLSPMGRARFVHTFGAVPAAIMDSGNLQSVISGAPSGELPVYATMLTAMFVHAGLLHLASNMIFLWVFGDNVESAFGHLTFLAFYLTAGTVAFIAQILVNPASMTPAIGASGAIAGALAAYLLLFPRAPVRVLLFLGPFFTLGRTAALPLIVFWFVLQLVRGVGSLGVADADGSAGGVAYFAHLGGFLFGALFTGAVVALRHEAVGRFLPSAWWDRNLRNWLLVVAAVALALAFAGSLSGPAALWLQITIVAAAALFAVGDGLLRASGRPAVLGQGHGFGKLLAVIQVLAALGILIGLLSL